MKKSMFHSTDGTEIPVVKDVDPKESTLLGIGFAWELGYTIAVPAILFGIGGGFLDKMWGTKPLMLFVGILLAFVCSAIIVTRRLRDIMRRLPKVVPKVKKKEELLDEEAEIEQKALHDLFRPPSA